MQCVEPATFPDAMILDWNGKPIAVRYSRGRGVAYTERWEDNVLLR
jgi:hypothetical protein